MIGLDVIFGGLTGLIGNFLTTWFKYKNAKLEFAHKEKMVELETQAMIEETKAQIQITKTKIEGEIELADSAAYKESQKAGQEQLFGERWVDSMLSSTGWASYFLKIIGCILAMVFAIVDVIRGLMRPSLTVYLVATSTYITYLAWNILEKSGIDKITSTQAVDIFSTVTSTIIFLAVSSVTWWFGDRTMSKYLQKREENKSPSSGGTPGGMM